MLLCHDNSNVEQENYEMFLLHKFFVWEVQHTNFFSIEEQLDVIFEESLLWRPNVTSYTMHMMDLGLELNSEYSHFDAELRMIR